VTSHSLRHFFLLASFVFVASLESACLSGEFLSERAVSVAKWLSLSVTIQQEEEELV